MPAFDPNVWYVLSNSVDSANNTLSVGLNTTAAFDPNNPTSVYYQPLLNPVPLYQQWQILAVSSEPAAYIMRNRQTGPTAQLTTGVTKRKCYSDWCYSAPFLSSDVNNASLWNVGRWTYGGNTEAGFLFNLGNGTEQILGSMDGQAQAAIVALDDKTETWSDWPGAGGGGLTMFASIASSRDSSARLEAAKTWTVSAHETFAPSDSAAYASIPTAVTSLVAQYTDPALFSRIVPYTPSGTLTSSTSSPVAAGTDSQGSKSTSGTSIGIGVGIGVGFLLVALVFAFFFLHYRRKRMQRSGTPDNPSELGSSTKRSLLASISSKADMYAEMGSDDMEKGSHVGHGTQVASELSHPSEGGRAEMAQPYYAEMGSESTAGSRHPSELYAESAAIEMPHPSYSTNDDSTLRRDGV